jgi:PAS domain S-box-containing protein
MTRPEPKYRREIGVAAMDRAITQGPQVYEWCYRSRAGIDMLSEAIATYVPLRERAVVMVQFRDITEEEATRRKLRRYETRLREFMQDLGEGVAVLTPRGKLEYISESGRRVLGVGPGEALGGVPDYCTPADRNRLITQLRHATSDQPTHAQRYRITRRDGATRWLRITCRRVAIENDLNGLLIHFRDISDEVATEEARRTEARMLEYAGRYNAMGEMATAIAHELSQPLPPCVISSKARFSVWGRAASTPQSGDCAARTVRRSTRRSSSRACASTSSSASRLKRMPICAIS